MFELLLLDVHDIFLSEWLLNWRFREIWQRYFILWQWMAVSCCFDLEFGQPLKRCSLFWLSATFLCFASIFQVIINDRFPVLFLFEKQTFPQVYFSFLAYVPLSCILLFLYAKIFLILLTLISNNPLVPSPFTFICRHRTWYINF